MIWITLWIITTTEEQVKDTNQKRIAIEYQQGPILREVDIE